MKIDSHNSKSKIAIIIPYFGKWPVYLGAFLETAAKQRCIDFHFITDLDICSAEVPSNVFLHRQSIVDMYALASMKINLKIQSQNTRKLCDLKPAYGLIFEDIIDDYLFWGYGDIDLIYGRLDFFLTPLLESYDIISFREEWLSGSFCVFRVNNETKTLFMKSRRWKEYLLSERHIAFDENCGIYDQTSNKGVDALLEFCELESFSQIVRQEELMGKFRVYRKKIIAESIPARCYLECAGGKIYDNASTEYAYYHYITEKRSAGFSYPQWRTLPETFFIDRYGFYGGGMARSTPDAFTRIRFMVFNAAASLMSLASRLNQRIRKLAS
jgi:hypothetical protein